MRAAARCERTAADGEPHGCARSPPPHSPTRTLAQQGQQLSTADADSPRSGIGFCSSAGGRTAGPRRPWQANEEAAQKSGAAAAGGVGRRSVIGRFASFTHASLSAGLLFSCAPHRAGGKVVPRATGRRDVGIEGGSSRAGLPHSAARGIFEGGRFKRFSKRILQGGVRAMKAG
jgi:hypothetical protein